eukprot:4943815-Prymnesium_polylepis.1
MNSDTARLKKQPRACMRGGETKVMRHGQGPVQEATPAGLERSRAARHTHLFIVNVSRLLLT